jgi:tRNA(fMet)-specific endonuclease VapC
MLYMLDTSTVSGLIRGASAVDARLSKLTSKDWCISAITHSELHFGLALRPDKKLLAQAVLGFLSMARTLPWDAAAAEAHGKLRAQLRQTGKSIGDFDEMIAAHALSEHAVVVTDNIKHFKRVPKLRAENWLR